MALLKEKVNNPADAEAIADAVELNCFWVDQLRPDQKRRLLPLLVEVLTSQLAGDHRALDEVALTESRAVVLELRRRYPAVLS